ncbi:hypothetical protein J4Q44_G00362960 [Coregonus suidteri]|uniref:Uncharacterized protein n=1 Tax=Coregonus suidteri TaxID=861788 RepID=A0AAN8KV65_9TELE
MGESTSFSEAAFNLFYKLLSSIKWQWPGAQLSLGGGGGHSEIAFLRVEHSSMCTRCTLSPSCKRKQNRKWLLFS